MISFIALLHLLLLAPAISAQGTTPPNTDVSRFTNQEKIHANHVQALNNSADANVCGLPDNLFNLASQLTSASDVFSSLIKLNQEANRLPDEMNQGDLAKILDPIDKTLARYYEELCRTLVRQENCYPVGPISKRFISRGLKSLDDEVFKLQTALHKRAGTGAVNPAADIIRSAFGRTRAALKNALEKFAT